MNIKELISLAKSGDSSAIQNLILKYQNELSVFCFYLTKNKEQALDLAQDSFLKMLEKLPTLKDPNKFKTWLFAICRNLFLDKIRTQKSFSEIQDAC